MSIHFEKDSDGIVTLTMDMPGRSMNVLNDELTTPFVDALGRIESEDSIKGVIVTSGKKEFLAGADIEKVRLGIGSDPRKATVEAGELLYNAAIEEIGTRYDGFVGAG